MSLTRFLTRPELFPARAAGEPWGDQRCAAAFFGGPYRFEHLDDAQAERIRGRLDAAAGTGGGIRVRLFRAAADEFRPLPRPTGADQTPPSYELAVDYGPASVRLAGYGFMALFELEAEDVRRIAVWTSLDGRDGFFDGAYLNVLRLATAYRALAAGGLLLHSAALARDGFALLFPGRSGDGKSTLSALAHAAGWEILSDELNVLVPVDGGLGVQQVPFAGDFGRDRLAPLSAQPRRLAALGRLRQSPGEGIAPLSPTEVLAHLLCTAPYVNLDPYRAPRLEARAAEIAAASVADGTAVRLAFARDSRLDILNDLLPAQVAA